MRIFVAVDMEGISGIFQSEQVSSGSRLYEEGRRFLTQDVNACIEGCLAGGTEQVVVRDIHGGGNHFIWEDLDPRAEYVRGSTDRERLPGIAECAGLVLLGYHAMAGTREAILEHTMSSRHWQNFWMNGYLTGEVGIDAGIAADHGVPTILVSGDDKVCREAQELLPGVVVAQVKTGLSCQGGQLLSREASRELIVSRASEAVRKAPSIRPLEVEHPVTMRLEVVSRGSLPNLDAKPYAKIIDGRTYEVTGDTVEQALRRL
jgi:D-amino peptidase